LDPDRFYQRAKQEAERMNQVTTTYERKEQA
jgi:hypothetical protein